MRKGFVHKKNTVLTIRREAKFPFTDVERLSMYVAGFFGRHRREKWPTVRQAARALGWRQQRVEEVCEEDSSGRLFLSSYFCTPPDPLGDHFVEHIELMEPGHARTLRTGGMSP
jgi:hypothetical protein